MKKTIALISALAWPTFAIDMFLPGEQGKPTITGAIGYSSVQGAWDDNGDYHSIGSDASITSLGIGLGSKFVPTPNLEVGFELVYNSASYEEGDYSEDASGLAQPDIFVKYAFEGTGAAPYAELTLPFGSKDIVGDDPDTRLGLGVILDKEIESFRLRGVAEYNLVIQGDGDPALSVTALPGFRLNDQFTPQLGLEYDMAMGDADGYSLTAAPGALISINEQTEVEPMLFYTLTGKNAYRHLGFQCNVYMRI